MRTQSQRRRDGLRATAELAELRVGRVAAMAIRETEIAADGVEPIELAVRHVVAHLVAAVVREPELAGLRLPREADRVAHALRDRLAARTIRIHADDLRVTLRALVAHVARRADCDVQLPVRTERDVAPAVMLLRGEMRDERGLAGLVEMILDVVVPGDLMHLGDVEIAVAHGNAVRIVEAGQELRDGAFAVDRTDRV